MYHKPRYENVKPVWFNPVTLDLGYEKSSGAIHFASTSEYLFYRKLLSMTSHLDIEISTHIEKAFGDYKWKLDFLLSTRAENTMICKQFARLANIINGSQFDSLNHVWIEYKGLQDDNFLEKMEAMLSYQPMLAKTVILVSSKTGAFGCQHKNRDILGFLTKPIVSVEAFTLCFNKSF